MKQLLTILSCLFLTTLVSCENDLNVHIPKQESKIVINSLLASDSLIRVHISKSSKLNQNAENIINANVLLKQDNEELGQMSSSENGWYTLNKQHVNANSNYQIEVSHPNFETCTAQTEVPEKVIIEQFFYKKKNNNQVDFTIEFQDNPREENYYLILLKGRENKNARDLEIFSDDIIFNGNLLKDPTGLQQNSLWGSRSFSDENRNGNYLRISFYIFNEEYDSSELFPEYEVVLYHITQDYYKYERSLLSFKNRDDLPFNNKINIYSNVKNGYGIFTSYAVGTKSVKIE